MKPVGFRELIAGCPGHSAVRWFWFQFVRVICSIWFKLFYRLRVEGHERLPLTGPVLIIANHQSYLDPIIIGIATGRRPSHMLARRNLFKPFFMRWLLNSLNGVPVDRGQADMASMRKCIEILKDGLPLTIFPEGTRTEDGSVLPFKAGMLLVARRGGAVVVPLAIAGSFEAWPRSHKLPRVFGRIRVRFGEPLTMDQIKAMGDDELALKTLTQMMTDEVEQLGK